MLNKRINANARIVAESFVAIGRDLKEMRDSKLYEQFGCGTFEEYCDKMTPIQQRHAYNFIASYEKYGERLDSVSDLGITKLTLMLALDDEDRERLIESGAAEELSTRELKKMIKELQSENEQLTLKLDDKSKEESEAETLRQQIERLNTELAAVASISEKQKERLLSLEKENRELSERPVEVSVQKPSDEDIAKIEKAAAEKAEKSAETRYKKDIAKLKSEMRKQADSERLTAVETARRENLAEIERLKTENAALQANAKTPPPSGKKELLKFCLEAVQNDFNRALDAVMSFPENEREKPLAALKLVLNKMLSLTDFDGGDSDD